MPAYIVPRAKARDPAAHLARGRSGPTHRSMTRRARHDSVRCAIRESMVIDARSGRADHRRGAETPCADDAYLNKPIF
jgi:hypothetical protein